MGDSKDDCLVVLDQVEKEYRLRSQTIRALRGVTLSLKRGQLVALSGPSGSGKTTLLNQIGGLERPSRGRVVVNGTEVSQINGRHLVAYRRRQVGFVFQGFNLVPTLSALDNVLLPLEFAGVPAIEAQQRAETLLDAVGLADRMTHTPVRLSGGQQQRVAIARALANDPPLLLADDPIGNLDSAAGREVIALLRQLISDQNQKRVVIIAGYHAAIDEAADVIVKMKDGKIKKVEELIRDTR